MEWIYKRITGKNNFEDYELKYGSSSDYVTAQNLVYNDAIIKNDLVTALSHVTFHPRDTVLYIGVNNGLEIGIVKNSVGAVVYDQLQLRTIGFDLSESALRQAAHAFPSDTFVRGDIQTFAGVDTGERMFSLRDHSVDIVFSFATFQSTSLRADLNNFLHHLEKKMNSHAQMFIGIPDWHITAEGRIASGLWDSANQCIDTLSAPRVSQIVQTFFQEYGYAVRVTGNLYKFYYASR